MAPPVGSVHLVYSGTLTGGEEFAFGYWAQRSGGTPTPDAFAGQVAALATAQQTPMAGIINTVCSSTGGTDTLTAYYYDGASTKAAVLAQVDMLFRGTGSAAYPAQIATVVTILSGFPGRSNRGRMYLPAEKTAGEAAGGMQMTSAITQSLATSVAQLMNAGVTPGFPARVISPTYSTMRPVTSVRVDSRFDTQRRRAESLVPRYVRGAVVNNT